MPDYKYQGTSRAGSSVSGVMTASSKSDLANILKRQQITPTKMTEKGKEFNIPVFGGGVSALERCCLGVPSILLTLAENQRLNAATLSQMGAALIVEESGLRDADNFARTIRALVRDKVGLLAMTAAAMIVGMIHRPEKWLLPRNDK